MLAYYSLLHLKRRSVSKQMSERFLRNKTRRDVAAAGYVLAYIAYLSWRLTILNPNSMTLSLTYFVAECFGFILGLTIILASRNYHHREPLPPLADRTVDIFVPAYKEPAELIRRTVMAAKEIDYPHQTWLLDDGKREELREMASELGVQYLRRPDNLHAKAGNLNYALGHSAAEFVMVFDADHIALPHALDVTLGFFADEKVAMVQTPQDYYNTDAFQYINTRGGGLWHDQSFFYNIGQSCADDYNSASCVGTGVAYRRSALDAIGGVPTTTITEDIHTSLKFHKAGYKVAYLNETIAYGEAAPDLKEYYKTRHRWGHGNLHALAHENVLFCKGLTLKQRLTYASLGLIHLEGWQQLMLFTVPVATLVLGWQPFEISIFNILVVLFFPVLSYLLLQEIGCGFARFWPNEIFAMARWPVHLKATAGLFALPMAWQTTLKHFKARVQWRLMVPQLCVLAVSLGALAYAVIKVSGDFQTGPLFQALKSFVITGGLPTGADIFAPMVKGYTVDLVIVSGFWALYNAARATTFVWKVITNAQNSHVFYRFKIPLPLALANGAKGRVQRISETWMGFTLYGQQDEWDVGDVVPLTLSLPAGPLEVRLKISALGYKKSTNISHIEGRFIWGITPEKRDQLARGLYSVDWHREFQNRQAYFLTPMDVITMCLTFKKPNHFRASGGKWNPVLYQHEGLPSPVYGIMSTDHKNKEAGSLVTFTSLKVGACIEGEAFGAHETEMFGLHIVQEEPISSLVQKGLDKAVVRRYRVQLASVAQKAHAQENIPQRPDKTMFSVVNPHAPHL